MGKEQIISSTRRNGVRFVVAGVIMSVALILVLRVLIDDNAEARYVLVICMLLFWTLYLSCMGIVRIVSPERTIRRGKNPNLLEMADDLYNNIKYSDDYITMSDNVISVNHRYAPQMAYRWSVFLVDYYEDMSSRVKVKVFRLHTIDKDNTLNIDVMNCSEQGKRNLVNTVLKSCPNAVYGENGNNMEYLKKMRYADLQTIPHSPYYVEDIWSNQREYF